MKRPSLHRKDLAALSPRHRDAKSLPRAPRGGFAALTVGALGIVYGDIGTSPLYAMDQLFFGRAEAARTPADVLGGVSLVIWTITIIVAFKYAILVLRAQNDGEGGVFALYGLLSEQKKRGTTFLLWSLMLGAGLLFGDGIITPAISVLSAVEGLQVATPALGHTVIPITVGLLTALFAIQFKGTSGIGIVFGPVLTVWFVVIAVLGAWQIERHPEILAAFNPVLGLSFLWHAGLFDALLILSALMLVVTGGEAMYADLGHFGARPIRTSWFAVVYPALLLNYLGQGAYLLSDAPIAGGKLFFSLVPQGLLYPMVLLATVATVIASQALISGAFSLGSQAIRLGLFPRLDLLHTHERHAGQIYVPFINWALFAGCILLVLTFGSSAALAAAYGLAVSGVMVITSLAMFPIARGVWRWGAARTGLVWGFLLAINSAFLIASSLKFIEGGYVPLSIGAAVFVVMTTWRWGRKATFAAYSAKDTMTIAELVALHRECKVFMERNAIVMSPKPLRLPTDHAPALMQMLWDRHGILPRNLILVEVSHRKVPYIRDNRYRVTVFEREKNRGSIIGVELSFGFMEEPNVERLLEDMARHKEIDLPTDRRQWIVHVSHENLLPAPRMGFFKRLRFRLFLLLRLVSQPAYYYYGLGDEVQLSVEIIPVRVR
ncbi:MAG: KUP/HAK/KT family potassium transporter [Xanthobacteraceae bacterium]|jgi:KUP system potassium uptake protein